MFLSLLRPQSTFAPSSVGFDRNTAAEGNNVYLATTDLKASVALTPDSKLSCGTLINAEGNGKLTLSDTTITKFECSASLISLSGLAPSLGGNYILCDVAEYPCLTIEYGQ